MPFFVSNKPFARVRFPGEAYTGWKRWFAWYPVSDTATTFWLTWVEWRQVKSTGSLGGHPVSSNFVEYKLIAEETTRAR